MDLFQITLIIATFLCSLVAGFLSAFSVVVMPGFRDLNDGEFVRAFQVVDGVIQKGQPVFMVVWIGSVILLLASAVLGFGIMDGTGLIIIILALLFYLFGVQLTTVTINVPLNNKLQTYDVATMDLTEQRKARQNFEGRWVRWNVIRTILSSIISLLLIILLMLQ